MAHEDIGITTLGGKQYGFTGRLFTERRDFVVQEIEDDGSVLEVEGEEPHVSGERRDFLVFTLIKEGLSTPEAIRLISRDLRINQKRIGYNGNKDKQAITSQRISIFKLDFERFGIRNDRMSFRDFAYSDRGCKIGALYGNRFTVRIRDFAGNDGETAAFVDEIRCGIPNFYGPQRFGSDRLNISVSKHIFARDFRMAFYTLILEGRNDGKSLEGYRDRMREVFGRYVLEEGEIDGEEAKELLDSLPGAFHNERMMLEHILEYRHDYIGAMRLLPKYFRLIIVQSYQSYLFNRVLSRLVEKSGIGGLPAEVPSVGYDLAMDDGVAGRAIREVLDSEGIEGVEKFRVTQIPEASLKTFMRPALTVPENVSFAREGDDAVLAFDLKKGSYATVLLMKMMGQESGNVAA